MTSLLGKRPRDNHGGNASSFFLDTFRGYKTTNRTPSPELLSCFRAMQNRLPVSTLAEIFKLTFLCQWLPRQWSIYWSMWEGRAHDIFAYWFTEDQPFWAWFTANISQSEAKELRQSIVLFIERLTYLGLGRPDVIYALMHLRAGAGGDVFQKKRHYFACFFTENVSFIAPSFKSWYHKLIEKNQVSMLMGSFHARIGESSALFRAFSKSLLAERQIIRMIFQMAFD